jgi:hypothetical protein
MFVPGQVIFLIVMLSGGTVSVRCEIVKFGGSLMPIIAARSACCASAALVTSFIHGLSLSLMTGKCITLPFGRMYRSSPALRI